MASGKSLLDPDVIQCPFPFYEELRKERPVTFMPELEAYFVSNHALAKEVLTDSVRFPKNPVIKDGKKFVPTSRVAREILVRDEEMGLPVHCISESDGERHTQFRKMAEPYFGNRASLAQEPFFQTSADELIDALESAETCEFTSQFSTPYTIYAVCNIIGAPRTLYNDMRTYADAAMAYRAYVLSDEEGAAVANAMVAGHGLTREMLRDRRRNPKSDLLTSVTQAVIDDKPLTEREQVYLIEEVLIGGYETTANSLNGAMLHLAAHPDLQETIRKDPKQTRAFLEEVFRMLPSIQSGHRIANADVELGGVLIKANSKIYVATGAADRDEAQFKCPASFDHHRDDLNRHIAFGGGKHFCLGAIITRVQQRIALNTWLRRFSSIELTKSLESIQYRNSWVSRAPFEVPLRIRRV
jgi:cytochrome P450